MSGAGCGCARRPGRRDVDGTVRSAIGPVPRLSSELGWRDRLDHARCRLGPFRNRYSRPPGLHALGRPGPDSEVLVTANYGLTVDVVRHALRGLDAWLLLLDTRGVNVWCAAGKGTFGTAELVRQVQASSLDRVVTHRRLIVPQLGAPGVAAHEVQLATGFRVHYGPVRVEDLPAWLRAGRVATAAMRRPRFSLRDRTVLIPIELRPAIKWVALGGTVLLLALTLALGPAAGWSAFLPILLLALAAVFAGGVVVPLALPLLPGRALSVKGLAAGAPITAGALALLPATTARGPLPAIAAMLLFPALSAFLALQFTGATTYTSLSGVRREMSLAVPLQLAAGGIALLLMAAWALGARGAS